MVSLGWEGSRRAQLEETRNSRAPVPLVLATAEIPDDLPRSWIELAQLPANWREPVAPPELAQIGDEFVREHEHCLLLVPSAIVPAEFNWLVNPAHPDYQRIINAQAGAGEL